MCVGVAGFVRIPGEAANVGVFKNPTTTQFMQLTAYRLPGAI